MSGHDFISRSELLGNLKATMRENGLDPENEKHWQVPIWDARMFDILMDLTPDADVVPKDFHERCMELEVHKRISAERIARECVEKNIPLRLCDWNKSMRLIDANSFERWLLQSEKNANDSGKEEFGDDVDRQLYYSTQSFIDTMRHRPTVDAEPVKQGRWMYYTKASASGIDVWACSECATAYTWVECFYYCPNCGAKMDKQPEGGNDDEID